MCEHTSSTKWLYALGGLGLGVVIMVGWIVGGFWNSMSFGSMNEFRDYRSNHMRSRNGMGMMDGDYMTMNGMVGAMQNKTGDAFDAAFLQMMIPHHQGAVDMASYAVKNAKHQEVKDLAKSIISSQTKEINQMKQWQTAWGYTQ